MKNSFEHLAKTWTVLGEEDPLWAVVSHEDKRGGRWQLEEFLETGQKSISSYHELLKEKADAPDQFEHVLDFGCGVGRLTQAWASRALRVTGIDISSTMIDNAKKLASSVENVEFLVNTRADLTCFPDSHFDLVASHICLQHMPWEIARNYVMEFGRVCRPGGWVAFQLPTRHLRSQWLPSLRKWLVNSLPFGLGEKYRRSKKHSSAVFDMYCTPASVVVETARQCGLTECVRQPDTAAGPNTESFIFAFRKSP